MEKTNYTSTVNMPDNIKLLLEVDNYTYSSKELCVLKAPAEIWTEIEKQLALPKSHRDINGCGSKSTWWIPENLLGLRVTPCCHIHDLTHSMSKNKADCDFSNNLFLTNLIAYINANSNAVMRVIRRHIGLMYYSFVFEYRKLFCSGYKGA